MRAAWSKGDLHWPTSDDGRVQLTREEFALLIGGIDLTATTKRKWYRKPPVEEEVNIANDRMNTGRFDDISTAHFEIMEADESCFQVAFASCA